MKPFTAGIINNLGRSLWGFIPIACDRNMQHASDFASSLLFKVENVEINDKGLDAIYAETNEEVRHRVIENSEDAEKFNLYSKRITEIEKILPDISLEYMVMLNHKTANTIADFLYEDW